MDDKKSNGSTAAGENGQSERKRTLLEMREEEKKPFWTPERKKDAREWVVSIGTALLVVFLIRTFLFTMIRVDGQSMIETLQDGERLFVSILDVKLNGVERGDVIICHYPNSRDNYVKRVVGLEGDTVEVRDGVTYLNGVAQEEAFVAYQTDKDFGPITVEEDKVFVMGDNRANSRDSRSSSVGPLDEDMIVGRVRFIWWPFSEWGTVE